VLLSCRVAAADLASDSVASKQHCGFAFRTYIHLIGCSNFEADLCESLATPTKPLQP
jgi:hypothetical protein